MREFFEAWRIYRSDVVIGKALPGRPWARPGPIVWMSLPPAIPWWVALHPAGREHLRFTGCGDGQGSDPKLSSTTPTGWGIFNRG